MLLEPVRKNPSLAKPAERLCKAIMDNKSEAAKYYVFPSERG